jgi:ribosomal protein L32
MNTSNRRNEFDPDSGRRLSAAAKLIECPECGHQVSRRAAACLSCGAPIMSLEGTFTKQRSTGSLIVIVLLGFFIWALIDGAITPAERSDFRQVGYFKGDNRDRIFSIEMRSDVPPHVALAHARQQPNTSGQMTAVYFYTRGSLIPADGLTLAKGVFSANDVLYEIPGLSKWRFAYMKWRNGTEGFVDCQAEPAADLCRQID